MAQPLPTDDNEVEFGATLIALKNNSSSSGGGSGSSEQVRYSVLSMMFVYADGIMAFSSSH
jgi:hypothetical protein